MHKKEYKEYANTSEILKILKWNDWYYNQENNFFLCHFFVHQPSHLLKRVKVVSPIQLSLKCKILKKKSASKNVICNTLVGSQMGLLKNVFKGKPVYFCWSYGEKPLYSDAIHVNEHTKKLIVAYM